MINFFKKLFHDCKFVQIEDINVFEEDSPYARAGQLQVCLARQCKGCARIQVKSHGIYNNGWQDIKGFITNELRNTTQDDEVAKIETVIEVGTPIVKKL